MKQLLAAIVVCMIVPSAPADVIGGNYNVDDGVNGPWSGTVPGAAVEEVVLSSGGGLGLAFQFDGPNLFLFVDRSNNVPVSVTWDFTSLLYSPGSDPLVVEYNSLLSTSGATTVGPSDITTGPLGDSVTIVTPFESSIVNATYAFNLTNSIVGSTVPEPSSLALCLIGGCGLWVVRKRRAAQG